MGNKYDDVDLYKAVDFDKRKKKYVLVEFPYPSGSGLHVGHAFMMVGGDVYARYHRMLGENVLFPMGWDAFGLPTENYALKTGISPQTATKENTDVFKKQMKQLGLSFDWTREVDTTNANYYKWTQWIFIKLFEQGLAEKQEMPINWCPNCRVGLANEEVVNGRHERCGTEVVKKNMSQWVVKITKYADRLIEGLKQTNFIEKVKAAQINWIDKREGAKIKFKVVGEGGVDLNRFRVKPGMTGNNTDVFVEVFTTRPDTLEGATFVVIAPEHELVKGLTENKEIVDYVEKASKKNELERAELQKEKTGVFSGLYAINPFTKKEIPIWIADYVLISYGTGAIMSVPSHDKRDAEFAVKYGLEINNEYKPDPKMAEWIEKEGVGVKSVNYHLRDWIFSRQHYWGEPIPMIYCEKDGWVPVNESDLPIRLPEVEKYQTTETGESPLASIESFVKTTCPKCGGEAKRETDTMPNWAGSDWYFLRYLDPHNDQTFADMEKMKYWLPVDVYVGGDEHNTLHLLYSRFIYQFLFDLGYLPKDVPEPYDKRLSHGVILGPDGNRMSKSKGNVIVPDEMANKYGADVVRAYLMFMGPFDATMAWNENSLMGVKRFGERLSRFVDEKIEMNQQSDKETIKIVNKLIKKVSDDIEGFKFNTSIAMMMESLNSLTEISVGKEELKKIVLCLAPFMPFLAEELWTRLGGDSSVHSQLWPKYDENLLKEEKVSISVQVNGKLRGVLEVTPEEPEESVVRMARENEKVATYLSSGEIRKTIYIKGKTISFVVG